MKGCFPLGGGKSVRPRVTLGDREVGVSIWWPLFLCGVERLSSSCSALFSSCCLCWLRVRCPKNGNKDLEHTLAGRVKGIEPRHLRFVGCQYNVFV